MLDELQCTLLFARVFSETTKDNCGSIHCEQNFPWCLRRNLSTSHTFLRIYRTRGGLEHKGFVAPLIEPKAKYTVGHR